MKAKLLLIALASALTLVSCEKEYSNREELDVVSMTGEACPAKFELLDNNDSPYKTMRITYGKNMNVMKLQIIHMGTNKKSESIGVLTHKDFDSCEINSIGTLVGIVAEDTETHVFYQWGDLPWHYYEDGVYYTLPLRK